MMSPDKWAPPGHLVLEAGALKAIRLPGNAAVTAGPGAGKTELLAQRADFLLQTGACAYPKRILAIAFKRDAAAVLRQRVRRRSGNALGARLDSLTFDAFARRLIELFRPLLTGTDALDSAFRVGKKRIGRKQVSFKELVPLAMKIIELEPRAARFVRMTYTHVFLDEFQDCTDKQYTLIMRLFQGTGASMTAVGDEKQRIMGFAGALKGVFGKFVADFNAEPIALYQNHRSKASIRRVQNAVARLIEPSAQVDDATIKGNGGRIRVGGFDGAPEEAAAIGRVIGELIDAGTPGHEIAVLYVRDTEYVAGPLCNELDRLGIPWRNEQELQDLLSEPVTVLMVNLLRALGRDSAPDAYAELMLVLPDSDNDHGLTDWMRFLDGLRRRLRKAGRAHLVEVMENVLDAFLERFSVANLSAMSADYADVDYLMERIAEAGNRLAALVTATGDLGEALRRFSADGTVRVMSIHKCKGMEFDAVFVPAVEEEQWWGDEDEERCAFFVAVSRARNTLIATYAKQRVRPDSFPGHRQWRKNRTPYGAFLDCLRPFATKG
ncbi:ATP-dependent helicase [Luteibacter anthropi]|uniref:UvrD-helicase domain-containing protein n=1 Tax=Luteibacter anthropi TaxID=564369 RepID=UPI002032BE59|nr:ATP-dependent helicase [Luteibacter anthropi]URX62058.1 ATP-dependent helicase [Luteibacter anthropi]